MKVLFYRYNSICEPDFIDAFKKAGLEVSEMTVEMQRKNIPGEERVRLLLEAITKEKPLFVFSIDYFPFISLVCDRVGVVYAALSVDCPVAEIYSSEIRRPCNRVFLFDRDQYESVKDENPGHIYYMPLGAATERLSAIPFPETYEYGVSFIGSLYNEKDRYALLKKEGRIEKSALDHMEELIARQLGVPGMDIIEEGLTAEDIGALKAADPGFYASADSVIDMDRYVAINNYLGNHLTSLDRIRVLNMLAERLPEGAVHLFTRSDTSELSGRVVLHGGVDTLTEMPTVFRSSVINLNLTNRTIKKGLPQRIWDILGSGSFCLTDGDRPFDGMLADGSHLRTFGSYEELPEICSYYLEHIEEAEGIAARGFEETAGSHSVLLRAIEIVKVILSEKLQ